VETSGAPPRHPANEIRHKEQRSALGVIAVAAVAVAGGVGAGAIRSSPDIGLLLFLVLLVLLP